MQHADPTSLWSRTSDALSWVASVLSMAAALGWMNLTVGALSACWLATQIYRFWAWEVVDLRRRHAQGNHANPATPPQPPPPPSKPPEPHP